MFELIRFFDGGYGEELAGTFETHDAAWEYAFTHGWTGIARMTFGEEGTLIRHEGTADEIL